MSPKEELKRDKYAINYLCEKYNPASLIRFINKLDEGFDDLDFDDEQEEQGSYFDTFVQDDITERIKEPARKMRERAISAVEKSWNEKRYSELLEMPRRERDRWSYSNSYSVKPGVYSSRLMGKGYFSVKTEANPEDFNTYGDPKRGVTSIKVTGADGSVIYESPKVIWRPVGSYYQMINKIPPEKMAKIMSYIGEGIEAWKNSDAGEEIFNALWSEHGNVAKVAEKDYERMRQCQAKQNYSAADKITDKNKAIARFVAGFIVEHPKENMRSDTQTYFVFNNDNMYGSGIYAFAVVAKKLGATLGDVLDTYDAQIGGESKQFNTEQIKTASSKKVPPQFFAWLTKKKIPYEIDEDVKSNFGSGKKYQWYSDVAVNLYPGEPYELMLGFKKGRGPNRWGTYYELTILNPNQKTLPYSINTYSLHSGTHQGYSYSGGYNDNYLRFSKLKVELEKYKQAVDAL